ncbi:hypothetical protein PIB30_038194 [Stylosanthes scabra]|uniref:Uncharacterized protein n=1 Tax=Stylosanthes scabra TaxID=79078 RepID=A0ABU6QEL2_9FABA|nr:hypothetical protein [Stylosanthes scabra]
MDRIRSAVKSAIQSEKCGSDPIRPALNEDRIANLFETSHTPPPSTRSTDHRPPSPTRPPPPTNTVSRLSVSHSTAPHLRSARRHSKSKDRRRFFPSTPPFCSSKTLCSSLFCLLPPRPRCSAVLFFHLLVIGSPCSPNPSVPSDRRIDVWPPPSRVIVSSC